MHTERSKVTEALKPILVLHLFFGYDYGLFKQNNIFVKYVIKIISTGIVVVLSLIGVYQEMFNEELNSFFIYPIQYFFEALMIIYFYGWKILDSLDKFNEMDRIMNIKNKYYENLRRNNIILIIIASIAMVLYMAVLILQNKKLMVKSLLFFILDISNILRISFFSLIRYRMKKLRKLIDNYYTPTDLNKGAKKTVPTFINPLLHVKLYKIITEHLYNFKQYIELTVSFEYNN